MAASKKTGKRTSKAKAPAKKTPKAAKPAPSNGYGLSERHWRFCQEFIVDGNATAAYIRAGYKNTPSADHNVGKIMGFDGVKKAIADLRAARAKSLEITAEDVLRRWILLADADPNELIELRRTCCRNCHGKQFGYQRTSGEMAHACAAWQVLAEKAQVSKETLAPFEPLGGEGYDGRKPPHPRCPECFGEGVVIPFPKDTRNLSEGAKRLYAGYKVTKDGIEIKMHDQAAALLNVAKQIGMLVSKHEHSGKDGGAIPITIIGVEIVAPESPSP